MTREHQSNRQAWNEAALSYSKEIQTSIELLKNGGMTFIAPELRHLKDFLPSMNRCIHLQCAGGTDTLSLINFGAKEVVGVDISNEMLKVAKAKSDALKMNATWIESDILETPQSLNGTADLVYTGKGAINWMMDIKAWAKVVARLLKPGAVLYLYEGHPITYFFDQKAKVIELDLAHQGYFSKDPYVTQDWPENYVGKIKESEKDQAAKYEKAWPIGDVLTAVLEAGLVIERYEEHPDKYWDEFINLPDDLRSRFPNTYSLLARKAK